MTVPFAPPLQPIHWAVVLGLVAVAVAMPLARGLVGVGRVPHHRRADGVHCADVADRSLVANEALDFQVRFRRRWAEHSLSRKTRYRAISPARWRPQIAQAGSLPSRSSRMDAGDPNDFGLDIKWHAQSVRGIRAARVAEVIGAVSAGTAGLFSRATI